MFFCVIVISQQRLIISNCVGSGATHHHSFGEGFDYPPLDTLLLAMPISWKGILQQYAGRLHRNHPTKTDVRIYDYVELGHPVLARMWEKRVRGYLAMDYKIGGSALDSATAIVGTTSE